MLKELKVLINKILRIKIDLSNLDKSIFFKVILRFGNYYIHEKVI